MSTAESPYNNENDGKISEIQKNDNTNNMILKLESHMESNNATEVMHSSSSCLKQKLQGESNSEIKSSIRSCNRSIYSKKSSCFTPVKLFEKENRINQENDVLTKHQFKGEKKRKFSTSHGKKNDFYSPSPSARHPGSVGVIMSSLLRPFATVMCMICRRC